MISLICSGIESLEPMKEWAWSCFSGILFGIHHLYIMQPVGIVSCIHIIYCVIIMNNIPVYVLLHACIVVHV